MFTVWYSPRLKYENKIKIFQEKSLVPTDILFIICACGVGYQRLMSLRCSDLSFGVN